MSISAFSAPRASKDQAVKWQMLIATTLLPRATYYHSEIWNSTAFTSKPFDAIPV